MKKEVLDKMKQLPPDKQQEVEDFVNYLINKYLSDCKDVRSWAEKRSRNLGRLKGQIWMAEGFNETPADFKDYL